MPERMRRCTRQRATSSARKRQPRARRSSRRDHHNRRRRRRVSNSPRHHRPRRRWQLRLQAQPTAPRPATTATPRRIQRRAPRVIGPAYRWSHRARRSRPQPRAQRRPLPCLHPHRNRSRVDAQPSARSRHTRASTRPRRAQSAPGSRTPAPPAHRNTRTRASIRDSPQKRSTTGATRRAQRRSRRSIPQRRQPDAPSRRPRRPPALPRPRPRYRRRSRPPSREPRPPRGATHASTRHGSVFRRARAPSSRAAPSGRTR